MNGVTVDTEDTNEWREITAPLIGAVTGAKGKTNYYYLTTLLTYNAMSMRVKIYIYMHMHTYICKHTSLIGYPRPLKLSETR